MESNTAPLHRLIFALIFSAVFDIVLSVGLFVAVNENHNAQHRTDVLVEQIARSNAAAQGICNARNESALNQHKLWEGLLDLPSSTPPDPAVLAEFRQLLDTTFPQVDCSRIGGGPNQPGG